ncbi:UNVERIFIED_CONTAM: hypothetical protein NCL1_22946 [Trichonephila clavipes]
MFPFIPVTFLDVGRYVDISDSLEMKQNRDTAIDTYADSSLAGRQLTPKLEVPIMQEDLLVCGVLGRDAMRMVQYHSES